MRPASCPEAGGEQGALRVMARPSSTPPCASSERTGRPGYAVFPSPRGLPVAARAVTSPDS